MRESSTSTNTRAYIGPPLACIFGIYPACISHVVSARMSPYLWYPVSYCIPVSSSIKTLYLYL